MPNLINLAPEGRPPIMVDADTVSIITENNERTETGIFTSANNSFISLKGDDYVAVQDCADRIAAAGTKLIIFPTRWPDSDTGEPTPRYTSYVNPSNFNYLKFGTFRGKPSHVLLGGKAYGPWDWIESSMLTEAEMKDLISAVEQSNQGLMRFNPENGEEILFDPGKIKELQTDYGSIRVVFGSGERNRVYLQSFSMPPVMAAEDMWANDPAIRAIPDPEAAWNEALEKGSRTYEQERKRQEQYRAAFTQQIAAAAPQLQQVENSKFPLFVKMDEVDQALLYDTVENHQICLLYKESFGKGHFYGRDSINAFFNNAADARETYKKFLDAGVKPYAQPPASPQV